MGDSRRLGDLERNTYRRFIVLSRVSTNGCAILFVDQRDKRFTKGPVIKHQVVSFPSKQRTGQMVPLGFYLSDFPLTNLWGNPYLLGISKAQV